MILIALITKFISNSSQLLLDRPTQSIENLLAFKNWRPYLLID